MKILLKQVFVASKTSSHFNKRVDIFIEKGIITNISTHIDDEADIIFNELEANVSNGWVDIFAHFNEPGFEAKETFETGVNAAIAGGFTNVFTLPNTNPIVDTKSLVSFILQKNETSKINIFPLGAISQKLEGKELAEMYDMKANGAIAFSDGLKPVQNSGLLLKALQYVKPFEGIIIQMPIDKSIGGKGLMNESVTSVQLGLLGIPAIAEELMIKRDIELLKYCNSNLHISGVSTSNGIKHIKEAKEEGLNITCSVTPYHLFFCDEDLIEYDTNLKVNPPLRSREDMMSLREAVLNGLVDCITAHHNPEIWDNKVCEFENASFGMIGLQTSFNVCNNVLDSLSPMQVAELFSDNARNIFSLTNNNIEIGANADLTLFTTQTSSSLNLDNNKSKSLNSPFFNKDLKGKVFGIVSKGQLIINEKYH